jgi:hypothetical protein
MSQSTHPHRFHNRLDLKLSTNDYTAPECGAINLSTGKPEFCDFECPALMDASLRPEPHWMANPVLVKARQAELLKENLQPAKQQESTSGVPIPEVRIPHMNINSEEPGCDSSTDLSER